MKLFTEYRGGKERMETRCFTQPRISMKTFYRFWTQNLQKDRRLKYAVRVAIMETLSRVGGWVWDEWQQAGGGGEVVTTQERGGKNISIAVIWSL